MGNRLSSIVTKTGDTGTTGLGDGSRRSKTDVRIVCLGEVDELNATIGVTISFLDDNDLRDLLTSIQHDLFDVGAELSQPGMTLISEAHLNAIEQAAESLNADLPPLKEFILPGGSSSVAHLHLARTVCRRVERTLVNLAEQEASNPITQRYINRLSDLFFVCCRYHAFKHDGREVYWRSEFSRIKAGAN